MVWWTSKSFFFHGSTVVVGQGLFIVQVPQWHSVTPQAVGFLWLRDRPVAEPSTSQERQTSEIRTRNLSSDRRQTDALDRAATGIDRHVIQGRRITVLHNRWKQLVQKNVCIYLQKFTVSYQATLILTHQTEAFLLFLNTQSYKPAA